MTNTADIVLFTVNEFETQEVWRAFEKSAATEGNGARMYWDYGTISGAHVVHALCKMADLATIKATSAAIAAWQPTLVIAVGIAWGADRSKQSIGDLLVADPLVDAAHTKDSTAKGIGARVEPTPQVDALRQIISTCHRDLFGFSPEAQTKLASGQVLSLPTLMDNYETRSRLLQAWPDAIGGEMEGRGLVDAAVERKCDWLLVKAICDWAYDKNSVPGQKDRDQQIAARNAADFVRYAVEHGLASYALHQRVVRGTANASASSPPGAVPMFNIGVVHGNVAGSIETQNNYFGRAGGEGT